MKQKGINYNNLLLIFYIPLVLLAKSIRYTLLKVSTVDAGIGHSYIIPILYNKIHFLFGWQSDANTLQSPASNNAIWLFQRFNWFNCQTYGQFEFAISIVFNVLLLWILFDFIKRNRGLNLSIFIYLCFFIGVLNIYTFVLSKEPVQMLYFLLIYLILRKNNHTKRWKMYMSILVCLLIMVTTRAYYLLMATFVIGIYWFYPFIHKLCKGKTLFTLLTLIIIAGGFYYVFLNFCQFVKPDEFAELIRVRLRISEDTVTDIEAIFQSENLGLFSVNYMITIVRLMFPVELLRFGPKYGLFVIFQLLVTFTAVKNLVNYDKLSDSKVVALCLYWGFLFCSATFEPDFGSWIRHESVTIPFFIFLLGKNLKESGFNVQDPKILL